MTLLWWLAQNALTGAVLAGLVYVLVRTVSLRPAVRHALWLIVLVKLMTPSVVTWPWCLGDRLPAFAESAATVDSPSPASAVRVAPETVVAAVEASDYRVRATSTLPTEMRHPTRPVADAPPTFAAAWLPKVVSLGSALLVYAWLCGAGWTLIGQLVRVARLRKVMANAASPPPWLTAEVRRTAERLGAPMPRVLLTADTDSPLVCAVPFPTLLWPACMLQELELHRYRSVVAHELAHLRRSDHWVGWLELAAACVWWWNPLLRLVRRELHASSEEACDAWVVWALPDGRRAYAEVLIDVSSNIPDLMPAGLVAGLGGNDRQTFERRLRMIMRDKVQCRMPAWGLALVAAVAMVALPGWSRGKAIAAPNAISAPETNTTSTEWPQQQHRGRRNRNAIDRDRSDRHWETTVEVSAELSRRVEALHITTGAGDIKVVPSDSDELHVLAVVKARKKYIDENEVSDDFEAHVRMTRNGDVLEIADVHGEDQDKEARRGWSVSLTISVPKSLAIDARSGAGDVHVTEASGSVSLMSGAGDVTLAVGETSLDTVKLQSGAGNVTLSAAEVDGTLDAGSGAGDVSVTLTDGGASGDVTLHSGAGSITLNVPDNINGDFEMQAPVGRIKIGSDWDLNVKRSMIGSKASGAVGGGGPLYKLHTGAGSISINSD